GEASDCGPTPGSKIFLEAPAVDLGGLRQSSSRAKIDDRALARGQKAFSRLRKARHNARREENESCQENRGEPAARDRRRLHERGPRGGGGEQDEENRPILTCAQRKDRSASEERLEGRQPPREHETQSAHSGTSPKGWHETVRRDRQQEKD